MQHQLKIAGTTLVSISPDNYLATLHIGSNKQKDTAKSLMLRENYVLQRILTHQTYWT